VLGPDRANGLAEACWTLREVDDIRALLEQTATNLSIAE
jgi:hypothetical protein